MTQAIKTQKQVQVIARYQIKRNGHVVYTVRSSNGQDTYTTTLVNGKATGCSCPSYKPCYHMVQLEAREAERNESKQQVSTPAATAEEIAAVAEIKAEAKMDAFLKSMDEQYASDPRKGLSQGEIEAARSNMVHLYDEY